ncbi:MAG: hypothetical protein AAF497_20320, partial [Planctomycetota bacterium]
MKRSPFFVTVSFLVFLVATTISLAQETHQTAAIAKWIKSDTGQPTIEFKQGSQLIRGSALKLQTEDQTIQITASKAGLEVAFGNTRVRMQEFEIMSPMKNITVKGISNDIAAPVQGFSSPNSR